MYKPNRRFSGNIMRRISKDPNKPTVKSKSSAVNIAKKYRNMGLNARVIPNTKGFNVYIGNSRLYYARRGFTDGRGPEPKVALSRLGSAYRGNRTPPMMNFNGYPIQYSNSKDIPLALRGKEALIHDLAFGGVMGQSPNTKNTEKQFFDIRQLDDGDVLIKKPVIVFDEEQKTWIIENLGVKARMFLDPEYSPPTVSFTGEVKFDRRISRREKNQFTDAIISGKANLDPKGVEGWLEERLKSYKGYEFNDSLEINAERMLGSKNWAKVKVQIEENSQENVFLQTMLEIAKGKRKADGFTGTKPIAQTTMGLPFVGYVPEWKLLGPAVEEIDLWIETLDGYDPTLNLYNNIKQIGGESATDAIDSLFEESKRFREDLPTGPGEGNKTYNKKRKLAKNREELNDEMWDRREEIEQEVYEMISWNDGFEEMSDIEREEILDQMYDEINSEGLATIDNPTLERFGINDEFDDGKYKSEIVLDLEQALAVDPDSFAENRFKVRQTAGSFGQFNFLNQKGQGIYSKVNEDMVSLLMQGKGGIDGSQLLEYVEDLNPPASYKIPFPTKIDSSEVFYETNKQYLNWMNEIGKVLSGNGPITIQTNAKMKFQQLFDQLKVAIEYYDTRDLDSAIINELVLDKLKEEDLLESINWQDVVSIRDTQDQFSQLNPAVLPKRKLKRNRQDNRIVNLDDMIENNDDIDGEDRFPETIDYANKLTELLDSNVEWIARGEQRNVFRPIKGEEGKIGEGNVLKVNRHLFIGDNNRNHPSVKGIQSDILTAQDTGFWEDYTTKRIKALGSNDWGDYSDLIVPAKTAGPGAVIQADSEKELLESYKRYAESGNWGSEIEMWREKTDPKLKNWASEQDLSEANFAFFSDENVYRLLDFYGLGLPDYNAYEANAVTPANAGVNSRFRKAILDNFGASENKRKQVMDEAMNSLDENLFLRAQNNVENANDYVLDEIDRMISEKGIDPVGLDGITVEDRERSNE